MVKVQAVIKEGVTLPVYASVGSSGVDVTASIDSVCKIRPGCSALIPTGIKVSIPDGYEIQVRPRSGLALKNQITVLNSPGTIDADYRGEICVILINHGKGNFIVEPAMRIAQLVLTKVEKISWEVVTTLDTTVRNEGGFGHTGV